jgi:hypothetical protein
MQERRLSKRSNVRIPFRFMETEKNKEGVGEITDISSSGAGMIVTCEKLQPLSTLQMWLEIPNSPEPLQVNGRVKWLKNVAPGIFRIGIKFDKVDFIAISQVFKIGGS